MSFNVNNKFSVEGAQQLSTSELQTLSNLYLPLISGDALTLYLALMHLPRINHNKIVHTVLLDQIGITGPNFVRAREKLEGFGLLSTFEQVLTLESQWVYEMHAPIKSDEFLSDKLLVKVLINQVGESQFHWLKDNLLEQRPAIEGKNITKGFFDIIHEDNFDHIPELTPPRAFQTSPLKTAEVKNQPSLDLELMQSLLVSFNISKQDLQAISSDLMLWKRLYGLDELKLVQLIQKNIGVNHQINVKVIDQQLRNDFQNQQSQSVAAESKLKVENNVSKNKTDQKAPTSAVEQLFKQAKSLQPLEFLADIRNQTGGIISSSERNSIEQLIKYNRLPDEVINMEIYALSVLEKRTTLPRAVLESTYSDWSQAKLKTVQDVVAYLQKRERNLKNKQQTKKSTTYQKRPVETQPDWKNQHVTQVSDQEQEDLKRTLSQMDAKRKEKEKNNS
ncbi:hypothetical protein IV73_GL000121 [Weissella kandleri]|uniref:Uncharacterized protein n=1 Tax=Weissella kandleri TaxID=1616 RepID=A0A0R2JE97_9LACO|nr:DnaD domain protein [Weissella kandleri]KRN75633.1 hypothetical protein IV73_GL000121 [Weissella kandleri]